jgi:hypothetical protein
MPEKRFRVFATCHIGEPAENLLREKGYDLETYPGPRTKGMAGRCIRGLIDVLEGNYGGNIRKMPYVVNKEAFQG